MGGRFLAGLCGALLLGGTAGAVQTPGTKAAVASVATASATDERAVQENQGELIRLLRMSPTLTSVVERDPSLLASPEYVNRTNPELGRFLEAHPEIAKNPDFYLFSGLPPVGGRRVQALERKVWPEYSQPTEDAETRLIFQVGPFLVFLCLLGAALWLLHVFAANRRWQRMFKLQMETHSKLIDRFGSSQELIQYMESEAGKRFLEAAPIPVHFEGDRQIPSVIGRVLLPLQIGTVMTLLGLGLLAVQQSFGAHRHALLLFGMMVLMPGIGFILSAGITWKLAGRLGLMPPAAEGQGNDVMAGLR